MPKTKPTAQKTTTDDKSRMPEHVRAWFRERAKQPEVRARLQAAAKLGGAATVRTPLASQAKALREFLGRGGRPAVGPLLREWLREHDTETARTVDAECPAGATAWTVRQRAAELAAGRKGGVDKAK